MEHRSRAPAGVDATIPNVARLYDYLLGGKDNFAADRDAAERIVEAVPEMRLWTRANRGFLARAVRLLVDAGIRQFLDVGTGLPTQNNVHEVARAVAPDARVVYVDYDPVVIVHAQELLSKSDNATIIRGDIREPEKVLRDPDVRRLLDLDEPVGVLLVGVLHLVTDDEDPAGIVRTYRDAMAPGSHLAISHLTGDNQTPEAMERFVRVFDNATAPMVLRPWKQVHRFFDGFDLVDPGVVAASEWRPESRSQVRNLGLYAGVGRRP